MSKKLIIHNPPIADPRHAVDVIASIHGAVYLSAVRIFSTHAYRLKYAQPDEIEDFLIECNGVRLTLNEARALSQNLMIALEYVQRIIGENKT